MWSGRATGAQWSRGLNVVLSKLWDLIKTHFIFKPVPLNHYLHILLDLRPSHLTVIRIYDSDGPGSSGTLLQSLHRPGVGGTKPDSARANTPVCADLLLMLTLMAKSNNLKPPKPVSLPRAAAMMQLPVCRERHNWGKHGSYTSEKMLSSSDRGQMLFRNML